MQNRNTPQENLAVIEYLLEQRNILRANLEAYTQASQREATHSSDANQIQDLNDDVQRLMHEVEENEVKHVRAMRDADILLAMKEKTIEIASGASATRASRLVKMQTEIRELHDEAERLKEQHKTSINLREDIIKSLEAELDRLRRYKCEVEESRHTQERWDFPTSIED